MIYSASRRTDMVAFAPDLIVEKVRRSRKLEAIVFWTKNPENFLSRPDLLHAAKTVPSIVQLTLTGLGGGEWEPNVPEAAKVVAAAGELARHLPPGAVRWRFDPIIAGADVLTRFFWIKETLSVALGHIGEVVVSFPDPYKKALARCRAAGLAWPNPTVEEKKAILRSIVGAFDDQRTNPVKLCCEPELLDVPGTEQSRCIDDRLFQKIHGLDLGGLAKDPGQREACGCVKSTDIGSYEIPCPHGCRYCYANPSV